MMKKLGRKHNAQQYKPGDHSRDQTLTKNSKFLNLCGKLDHQASQDILSEIEAIILIIQGEINNNLENLHQIMN